MALRRDAIVLVAVLLSAVLAAAAKAQPGSDTHDWPMYGRDHANSVHAEAETILGPHNVADLVERWRVEGIAAVTGTPVVVDGVVHFGDWLGSVFAVDAADGSVIWHAQPGEAQVTASVAVAGDVVLAADLRGRLRALDRATGELRWETHLRPPDASAFSSPVIIDDMVVIGFAGPELGNAGGDGFRSAIVALDIDDGREAWRVFSDVGTEDPDTWVPIWSSAAYDPALDLVFIGTGNTNTLVGDEQSRSRIDDAHANALMAIHRASGEVAWVTRLVEADEGRDFDVGASPNLFIVDGVPVVGVGSKAGDYAVLDRRSGEILWHVKLTEGSPAGGVMSTAAVDGDTISVASNAGFLRGGTIFSLDAADGSIRWQTSYDAPILGGSMALANGVLFRGRWDGALVALDAADGAELWSTELEGAVASGVSVSEGMIFVGFGSGSPPSFIPVDGGVASFGLP